MKIFEILDFLEKKYPLHWQLDFDNCGVQCGDIQQDIMGVTICFDVSESVIDDAIAHRTNLIISHHPLIFSGLKKITPTYNIGKIICKAIENQLVIYSMHTNMDCAINGGNDYFAQKLNLSNLSVLEPAEKTYQKIAFYIPSEDSFKVKNALFEIGCGNLGNYSHCSYSTFGYGTFFSKPGASPHIGNINHTKTVEEEKVEMIFPAAIQKQVIATLYATHPYEEPAFDIYKIENPNREIGLGRIGTLPYPMETEHFLQYLKSKLHLQVIRYSGEIQHKIERVAVCGGSGSSLIGNALAAHADAFVTGDIRYHDFQKSDNEMLIADIGHFEGEHFIREIIYNELKENFTTFASYIFDKEICQVKYI